MDGPRVCTVDQPVQCPPIIAESRIRAVANVNRTRVGSDGTPLTFEEKMANLTSVITEGLRQKDTWFACIPKDIVECIATYLDFGPSFALQKRGYAWALESPPTIIAAYTDGGVVAANFVASTHIYDNIYRCMPNGEQHELVLPDELCNIHAYSMSSKLNRIISPIQTDGITITTPPGFGGAFATYGSNCPYTSWDIKGCANSMAVTSEDTRDGTRFTGDIVRTGTIDHDTTFTVIRDRLATGHEYTLVILDGRLWTHVAISMPDTYACENCQVVKYVDKFVVCFDMEMHIYDRDGNYVCAIRDIDGDDTLFHEMADMFRLFKAPEHNALTIVYQFMREWKSIITVTIVDTPRKFCKRKPAVTTTQLPALARLF